MLIKMFGYIIYPLTWAIGFCWHKYLVWFKRMDNDEALDYMQERWERFERGDFKK